MSNPIPAEIHTHSVFSDGQLTPEELAARLAKAGVKLWSLTDHDTCEGNTRAAAASKEFGLDFVNGIEISAYDGVSVHVLGYGVATDLMESFTVKRLDLRTQRMQQMVANLNARNVRVSYEHVCKLAGEGAIGRPHLAAALIERGYVASIPEAFSRFIGSRCKAYVATEWPSVEQAIDVIHDAGGLAVLAHPEVYGLDFKIPAWVVHGLDGVEVEHPRHDGATQLKFEAIADRLRVLKTASTDFHGPKKLIFPLGKTYLDSASMQALGNFVVKE